MLSCWAGQPKTPTPPSTWPRTTGPTPPRSTWSRPRRSWTDSARGRMCIPAESGSTATPIESSTRPPPSRPPPITPWRADNEKQVLARAAEGGHPVLVMPGVVYGHGGGLVEQFLGKHAREGSAHYRG